MGATDEFLTSGLVRVEHALDPDFCEAVVSDGFERMGIDEHEPAGWPTGTTHLPVVRNWSLDEVAPSAASVLDELVGADRIAFAGVQDNLIVNLPDPTADWRDPVGRTADPSGWHKDGDWFRHFLDSPEQALLVIVFWRDVASDQGATYVAPASIGAVARLLRDHPEGLDPTELKGPVAEIITGCGDATALTGAQGTIVFAHPFTLHTASVNQLGPPRVISNSSVMLREPMRFDRPDGTHSAVEQSILHALGVERLTFEPSGPRRGVVSERELRWSSATDDVPSP